MVAEAHRGVGLSAIVGRGDFANAPLHTARSRRHVAIFAIFTVARSSSATALPPRPSGRSAMRRIVHPHRGEEDHGGKQHAGRQVGVPSTRCSSRQPSHGPSPQHRHYPDNQRLRPWRRHIILISAVVEVTLPDRAAPESQHGACRCHVATNRCGETSGSTDFEALRRRTC